MLRFLSALLIMTGCSEYDVITDLREQTIDAFFTVEGVKVDVLFYADTSHSMDRELYDLSKSIDSFTSRLDESDSDWQIIAVTGPTGCANGGIITRHSPDWEATFATAIQTKPGEDDVDEWGLFNVFKAVLETTPGGCNAGFARPDASLHVIILSDEADHSPGYLGEGDYWRDYVDPVAYLKDESAQVKFSAVVGPVPHGCEGADPGLGYADAVQYTGGELLSICGDWLSDMELLADASVIQDFFPLKYAPLDGEEVVVMVNDEDRTTGWEYDADAQGIRFTEAPPGAWDEVFVRYRALVEVEVERE